MDSNNFTKKESMLAFDNTWSTPASQCKSGPIPIYENASVCDTQRYSSMPSCNSYFISSQQLPSETMSRPGYMAQGLYPSAMTDYSSWMGNPAEEQANLLEEDFYMFMKTSNSFTTNGTISVLDHKKGTLIDEGQMAIHEGLKLHCASASSFPTPPSSRYYDGSSLGVSGVCSDLSRNQSCNSCASPSFGNRNDRYAPYGVEGLRLKQYPQVIVNTSASCKPIQHGHQTRPDVSNSHQVYNFDHSSPTTGATPLPFNYLNLRIMQEAPQFFSSIHVYQRDNMLLPTQLPSQAVQQHPWQTDVNHLAPPEPVLSQGLFRVLQSNGHAACLNGHYTDLCNPPDLYAALREEQIPPPSEDMNPEDPDMIPCEQEMRFEGDLYTPRWIRGRGNKREGWCGICKPGRWLVLKNSAFWYDKSFSHGISAATGNPFQEPQQKRRMDGKPDVWEGLCGSCEKWIALISSKKKGTAWFRHVYKCHTHFKVKDTSKRRRKGGNAKGSGQASRRKLNINDPWQ